MNKFIKIICSPLLLLLLPYICMADNEKGKTYRYEGEASFDIILFGLGGTTTHGVRFTDSDMFIGATAGYYSCYSNEFILASVQPKWYFADNDKRDIYISCDIGAAYMFSGSYEASSPSYHYYVETLNAAFVPRIGIGFKSRGRLLVDLSFKYMMLLNPAKREYSRNILDQYGLLCIGIRF